MTSAGDLYKLACACDREGREAAAIPLYVAALKAGLDGDDRAGALLGLGSSLRNVGRPRDAARLLAAACHAYPDHLAMRLFLALALHDAGLHRDALRIALDVALACGKFDGYERALADYRDSLQ